jgi:hypothetical protein
VAGKNKFSTCYMLAPTFDNSSDTGVMQATNADLKWESEHILARDRQYDGFWYSVVGMNTSVDVVRRRADILQAKRAKLAGRVLV